MVSGSRRMHRKTTDYANAQPIGIRMLKTKTAEFPPPFRILSFALRSAEELKHALLRLVGERERRDRDRLAGRQRLAVGRLFVRIGQRQVRRTGLQHVDQVLVEVLADLHEEA